MGTTVDIASNLLERARRLALEEKVTIRELIQEGLGLALARREENRKRPVKPAPFGGRGLGREFRRASWAEVRKAT
ncbi:MAG: DUF2191 domain-containing protein [Bryobacteraceae bacterium]